MTRTVSIDVNAAENRLLAPLGDCMDERVGVPSFPFCTGSSGYSALSLVFNS